MPAESRRPVAIWLLAVAALLFGMILLGGATRLTHSGLSIVDWKPLMGVIPPLSEADWQASFARYQAFPEYRLVNQGMTLGEYQRIFYFEYFHRLLGRVLGLAFALPFALFWLRGALSRGLSLRLGLILTLGACQGVLGWYMVQSGLVDLPRVSAYRLSAHLMLAVLIYASLLWTAFDLLAPARRGPADGRLYRASLGGLGLIALTILSGGLMAGTRAGFAYPSFPLMAGRWIPEGLLSLRPLWLNAFENATTIHFNHRLLAMLLALSLPLFALRLRLPRARRAVALLLAALALQLCLGLATLLLHLPVLLALAHQGGAILLLSSALYLCHGLRPVRPEASPALAGSHDLSYPKKGDAKRLAFRPK